MKQITIQLEEQEHRIASRNKRSRTWKEVFFDGVYVEELKK